MKKLFFLFAMLTSVAASAQNVQVQSISTTYTNTPIVKFRVAWTGAREFRHNTQVWVFVDYRKVENNALAGSWTRAAVTAMPFVNSTPASSATLVAGNDRGFWLNGVDGDYSATVTVPLTLAAGVTQFSWCAYATDYPPFVIANNGTYTLQGTPPFILKAANGSAQTVTGNTLPASSLTIAAVTLTDKTECPGDFCPYTGSDLYRDATHLCGHRPTGAQNWEAWIRDTRDNEYYRIVLMPDNKWWLAQNVKYAQTGSTNANCSKDECGLQYTYAYAYASYDGASGGSEGNVQGVCPPGWLLPVVTDWHAFADSISLTPATVLERLRPSNSNFSHNDYYGWAQTLGELSSGKYSGCGYYANCCGQHDRHWGLGLDKDGSAGLGYYVNNKCCIYPTVVRCFCSL